jgi:excisionase family DNA binding protein
MRSEARKQEIVRAALETIAEHGVQGATISRIAKGAGITPAALYAHFENRKAILLAALDVVYDQVFDSFRSSSSPDPLQRLREICEHHAEKVRNQDKTSHAHLFLEFVASAPEEGLREALREKEQATASYLASIVEELKDRGDLPPDVEPQLIAWLIAGWAWTGDVASSMGVTPVWSERVSPRLLDFIFGLLSGTAAEARAVGPRAPGPPGLDGLPNGAVFTVEEAAAILKVSPETVSQMLADRELMAIRVGGQPRIPRRALLALLRGIPVEELG